MRNTDKTESHIYITDVSYNIVDTIHMIQLQLSTLEVIYTSTLSTNIHEYISFYTMTRLLQNDTDNFRRCEKSSNPEQQLKEENLQPEITRV